MEGNSKIILAHSELDFSDKFAGALETCGYEVSVVKSLQDVAKKIEASGIKYSMVGFPLDQVSLSEVNFFDNFMQTSDLETTKLFAVTSKNTQFSPVALQKIKILKPRDFIKESSSAEEILFRLSNILFEESGLRKNSRSLCNAVVHCDYMQDFFDAQAFTISRDGIFIKTDRTFPLDAKVFMTFSLPESKNNFATMGNILYTIGEKSPKPRISPPGSGIFFVDLEDESRDKIDDFVRQNA